MLDRREKYAGSLLQPPRADWKMKHLSLVFRIGLQATLVHHFRHKPAKSRMHPESGLQEYAKMIGDDGVLLQVISQRGRPALAGMRPLNRLFQLHLVSQEHKVPCRSGHGGDISERNLTRFVHKKVIEPLDHVVAGEQPGSSRDKPTHERP